MSYLPRTKLKKNPHLAGTLWETTYVDWDSQVATYLSKLAARLGLCF
jgi:hypothetical protein